MRLAYCWLRLWDGVRFPVKQYRGEIKRLSRHRGGYLDDTCEILFFSISFFFFLPIFTHLDLFSTFLPSIRRPSIFPSIPLSFLVSPTLRRKGFLGDTILERSNCSYGFLVLLFFFFSLFDSIRMRLIALKPFLWIKIAIWDASIYTTTYIIQYVCSF